MRRMRELVALLAVVAVGGCAQAGDPSPNAPPVDGRVPVDGDPLTPVDAGVDAAEPLPLDAALLQTLSQTADTVLGADNYLVCGNGSRTVEYSWYRVFSLAEHGIVDRPFYVNQIAVGVARSNMSLQATIKVGTWNGAFGAAQLDPALITVLSAVSVAVPASQNPAALVVPITATIPANGNLLVEVLSPTSPTSSQYLLLGTNTSAQTHDGYFRSPECSIPNPVTTTAMGRGDRHMVLTVSGQY